MHPICSIVAPGVRARGAAFVSAATLEMLLMLGLFACGTLAGLLSRWGPLSGWAALAFPLVLAPFGIGLTRWFC